jgi:hypothetical protein
MDDAKRFQAGFGGELMRMIATLDHLSRAMELHPSKHHHQG